MQWAAALVWRIRKTTAAHAGGRAGITIMPLSTSQSTLLLCKQYLVVDLATHKSWGQKHQYNVDHYLTNDHYVMKLTRKMIIIMRGEPSLVASGVTI